MTYIFYFTSLIPCAVYWFYVVLYCKGSKEEGDHTKRELDSDLLKTYKKDIKEQPRRRVLIFMKRCVRRRVADKQTENVNQQNVGEIYVLVRATN